MDAYHYYATSKPGTVVVGVATLVDRRCCSSKRLQANDILVVARPKYLDFYDQRGRWNMMREDSTNRETNFLFSVALYTSIQQMATWTPGAKEACPGRCSPGDASSASTSLQDGLVLLSQSFHVYLVRPDYLHHTIRLDYQAHRVETPLLSVDPYGEYVIIYTHKPVFYVIKIGRNFAPGQGEASFFFESPTIVSIPTISPRSICFAKRSYAIGSPTTSHVVQLQNRLSVKSIHPQPAVSLTQPLHSAPVTKRSRANTKKSVAKRKGLTLSNCPVSPPSTIDDVERKMERRIEGEATGLPIRYQYVMVLLYTGSKKPFDNHETVESICCVDMCDTYLDRLQEALYMCKGQEITEGGLSLQGCLGGFLLLGSTKVTLYAVSQLNECTPLMCCSLQGNDTLQNPLRVAAIGHSAGKWVLGDFSGYVGIVGLHTSSRKVSKSTREKKDENKCDVFNVYVRDVSHITIRRVGSYGPVSCLAAWHDNRQGTQPEEDDVILFVGSTTGDSLLLQYCVEEANSRDENTTLRVIKRLPSLGPIADFTFWTNSARSQRFLICATGYSTTGCIRMICEGPGSTPLYTTRLPGYLSVLGIVAQGFKDKIKSILIFHTSYVSPTSVYRLKATSSSLLELHDVPTCPKSLLQETFLYMGHLIDYPYFVQVTPYNLSVVHVFSLSVVSSTSLFQCIGGSGTTSPVDSAVGNGPLLACLQRDTVYMLEFDSSSNLYQIRIVLSTTSELRAVDILRRKRLLGILDWKGEFFLYQWEGSRGSSTSRWHYTCVMTHQFQTTLGSRCLPCSLALTMLKPRVAHKEASPNQATTKNEDDIMTLLIGFSNGALEGFTVIHATDSQHYALRHVHYSCNGATPVALQKLKCSWDSHDVCHGILAVSNAPVLVFWGHVSRLLTTALAMKHIVDVALLDAQVVEFLLAHPSPPFASTSNTSPLRRKTPSCFLMITLQCEERSQEQTTFRIVLIEGLDKLHMITIPIRVSPERITLYRTHPLIIVAAIDEEPHHPCNPDEETHACMLLIHPTQFTQLRVDLDRDEYPTALLSCSFAHNGDEYIILGSTSPNHSTPGCVKIFLIKARESVMKPTESSVFNTSKSDADFPYILELLTSKRMDSVNAITVYSNYLIVGSMNQVKIFSIKIAKRAQGAVLNVKLGAVTEYWSHCYIHSLEVLHHHLLIGYMSRSLGVYKLNITSSNEDSLSIIQLDVDHRPTWNTAACFGSSPSVLYMADDQRNLISFRCTLSASESETESETAHLQRAAFFHTGESIHRLVTVPQTCTQTQYGIDLPRIDNAKSSTCITSHLRKPCITHWSSNEGAFGVICEISLESYNRLQHLQRAIICFIPSPLGVTMSECPPSSLCTDNKDKSTYPFINGDVVEKFLDFPPATQLEIWNDLQLSYPGEFHDVTSLRYEVEEIYRSHM